MDARYVGDDHCKNGNDWDAPTKYNQHSWCFNVAWDLDFATLSSITGLEFSAMETDTLQVALYGRSEEHEWH